MRYDYSLEIKNRALELISEGYSDINVAAKLSKEFNKSERTPVPKTIFNWRTKGGSVKSKLLNTIQLEKHYRELSSIAKSLIRGITEVGFRKIPDIYKNNEAWQKYYKDYCLISGYQVFLLICGKC